MDAAPKAYADDRRLPANSNPSNGAEFYCDTLRILKAVEQLSTSGTLYPKDQEGLAKAFGWWIEKGSFFNEVCLTIGNMPGLPQELIDERLPLFGVNLDPQELRPKRALYLQRVNAHLGWLAEVLADGRKFILGNDPSAADLSAYHPIWFARQNGGSEVNELIAFATTIDPWYKRVGAVGHGKFSEMTPDQAIDAARPMSRASLMDGCQRQRTSDSYAAIGSA